MKPKRGKAMNSRAEAGMAFGRTGTHAATEKHPPKAEDAQSSFGTEGLAQPYPMISTNLNRSTEEYLVHQGETHKSWEGDLISDTVIASGDKSHFLGSIPSSSLHLTRQDLQSYSGVGSLW